MLPKLPKPVGMGVLLLESAIHKLPKGCALPKWTKHSFPDPRAIAMTVTRPQALNDEEMLVNLTKPMGNHYTATRRVALYGNHDGLPWGFCPLGNGQGIGPM